VTLAGTKRDETRCRLIAAAAPGACDLCGKTTPADLAALIQRAEVAVTNDSGSMHVAASLGKPMVSVFGPTNPVHIGPYQRPESVVRMNLPCSPCNYKRLSQCPFDLDLCGKTTPADLAALIQRAEVAVTNDSGSMHVAASLGKPMVSVFGPTNPVHIGPYQRPESVVRMNLPCSPCNYKRLSQCPFD